MTCQEGDYYFRAKSRKCAQGVEWKTKRGRQRCVRDTSSIPSPLWTVVTLKRQPKWLEFRRRGTTGKGLDTYSINILIFHRLFLFQIGSKSSGEMGECSTHHPSKVGELEENSGTGRWSWFTTATVRCQFKPRGCVRIFEDWAWIILV